MPGVGWRFARMGGVRPPSLREKNCSDVSECAGEDSVAVVASEWSAWEISESSVCPLCSSTTRLVSCSKSAPGRSVDWLLPALESIDCASGKQLVSDGFRACFAMLLQHVVYFETSIINQLTRIFIFQHFPDTAMSKTRLLGLFRSVGTLFKAKAKASGPWGQSKAQGH